MYYEIFTGLISTIGPAAISTVVKCAVERWFGKGQATQKNQVAEDSEPPLIAIPLAIGYYYNFIEKIEDRLAGDNLTVKKHYFQKGGEVLDKLASRDDQTSKLGSSELEQIRSNKIERTDFVGRFESGAVSVELIYPKELSNRALRNCSAFLSEKTNRGSIESSVSGRPYGINYHDVSITESPSIRIVDYTRPVEVIPKYYQEIRGLGRIDSDPEAWKSIEEKEMQAFLFTLKFLIENKARFLYDKVYYRPYDN